MLLKLYGSFGTGVGFLDYFGLGWVSGVVG